MRLIYAGTPEFAVPALEALLAAGHDVRLVLTQPDRPAGRGLQPSFSAVKQCAQKHALSLYQPTALKVAKDWAPLIAVKADAMVVAAYGLIFPQVVLDIPCLGAFNIHASLLPRWRGAAPIHRALLAGDDRTGVCIMRMEAGLDTGPVLSCEAVPMATDETAGGLHDKLARLGARMIEPALAGYARGELPPRMQPSEGVTYASKIAKAEARIDWTHTAAQIERQIRAFNPAPGASARIAGTELKLWSADLADDAVGQPPGTILRTDENAVVVACGESALSVSRLQRPGGKPLGAREFLRGFKLLPGQRFDSPGN